MHRFYLPPTECESPPLWLTGREAHHALHVLRLRPKEKVIVLDGVGNEYLCEAGEPEREEVKLSVVQKNFFPLPTSQITLLQAIPKGKIIESIIQKGTELGTTRIVPLLSERVATQLDDESAVAKVEKWRLTAIEAIKQCGAVWLPTVEAPMTPKEFLARAEKFELPLIASLQSDRRHPREYFQAFYAEHQRLPRSVCVWVGPEGDFTPAELGAIKSAGALPITLGRLVLRSETAAIYCLSVLNYELQCQKG
ncbi:MAG: 16S rRNA (uracil(1498)-N(3))-methyltransferase [Verrucomicrobia bacterium]|nr:16S rRNA (uracil(1498)-N(3))-methyltransferase [Verrucomicrobiota bacterium]